MAHQLEPAQVLTDSAVERVRSGVALLPPEEGNRRRRSCGCDDTRALTASMPCSACGAGPLLPHLSVAGTAGDASLIPSTGRLGSALPTSFAVRPAATCSCELLVAGLDERQWAPEFRDRMLLIAPPNPSRSGFTT